MPSADELRARIVQISDSIAGHKQAIRDLELERCVSKSELNTLLDPMSRLPFEMISDIFLLAAPNAKAASALSAVCRSWNRVALSMPSLWTTISNRYVKLPAAFTNLLNLWLARGQNLPVSMTLGYPSVSLDAVDLIISSLNRLEKLNFSIDDLACVSSLRGLAMKALTHLTVNAARANPNYPEDLLEIMRNAPNLGEFCIYDAVEPFEDLHFDSVLTHASLQHLRFGRFFDDWDRHHPLDFAVYTFPEMLSHLTSPSLHTLQFFPSGDILGNIEMLLAFLNRSSPPLRSLQLGSPLAGRLGEITLSCLRLMPTLTNLHVLGFVPHILELLIPDPALLPDLRDFKITGGLVGGMGSRPEFELGRVLSFLTERRANLRSFQLLVISEPAGIFGGCEHITDSFRQLAKDSGMHICIGTQEKDIV